MSSISLADQAVMTFTSVASWNLSSKDFATFPLDPKKSYSTVLFRQTNSINVKVTVRCAVSGYHYSIEF